MDSWMVRVGGLDGWFECKHQLEGRSREVWPLIPEWDLKNIPTRCDAGWSRRGQRAMQTNLLVFAHTLCLCEREREKERWKQRDSSLLKVFGHGFRKVQSTMLKRRGRWFGLSHYSFAIVLFLILGIFYKHFNHHSFPQLSSVLRKHATQRPDTSSDYPPRKSTCGRWKTSVLKPPDSRRLVKYVLEIIVFEVDLRKFSLPVHPTGHKRLKGRKIRWPLNSDQWSESRETSFTDGHSQVSARDEQFKTPLQPQLCSEARQK